MAFLPDNYEIPASGGRYFKPANGTTRLRILSKPLMGYEAWDRSGDKPKPVRCPMGDDEGMKKLQLIASKGETEQDRKVSHFWAMPIYNADTGSVQIWQVKQGTIQGALIGLVEDEDWGDPCDYWIKLTKTGEKLDTKYTVIPAKRTPLSDEIQAEVDRNPVTLENLFTGEDPFEVLHNPAADNGAADEDDDSIPF